jgi:hypothetical protein
MRRNLHERHQNERSDVEERVRQDEAPAFASRRRTAVEPAPAEIEHVDVDGPRTPARCRLAPGPPLDLLGKPKPPAGLTLPFAAMTAFK